MHNNILAMCDTDGLIITKPDMSLWTKQDRAKFVEGLNKEYPELIRFSDDGYLNKVLILKAKNYVMEDEYGEVTIKGSGLTDKKKEPALLEFLHSALDIIINGDKNITDLYHIYLKEAMNITDITRWAVKKTITDAIYNSERSNESKVRDAIEGETVQEGDKIYVYTAAPVLIPSIVKGEQQFYKDGRPKMREDNPLKLIKNWTPGDENKLHYVERVYKTLTILENVIQLEEYTKYHTKKGQALLEILINE